jgi:hypothetical protein
MKVCPNRTTSDFAGQEYESSHRGLYLRLLWTPITVDGASSHSAISKIFDVARRDFSI